MSLAPDAVSPMPSEADWIHHSVWTHVVAVVVLLHVCIVSTHVKRKHINPHTFVRVLWFCVAVERESW